MIVVIGGTGTVGSDLLPLLFERNVPVRALAHSAASREKIQGFGVEAMDGDLDEPDSLEPVMQGSERLFLLSPTHPDLARREVAAVDAARRAGVRHIVKLSTVGADRQSPSSLLSRHGEVEEHLIASGLDYTILRPTCYMHVHLLPVQTVTAQGAWYGMTGGGAHAYIDTSDIAKVVATVLTTGSHARQIYELSGPRAMSMPEAAAALSQVIASDVAYVDLPAEQFRAAMVDAGLPDWLADGVVELYQIIREGHLATVTNMVEELTGQPPRTYQEFAEANKRAFVTP